MKKLLIILFFSNMLYAQKTSTDLNYSGMIFSKNHNSVYFLFLDFNYSFENYNFSIGPEITALSGFINTNVISQQPSTEEIFNINELSFGIGITGKYYPKMPVDFLIIQPFIGLNLGLYIDHKPFGITGNLRPCELQYKFDIPFDFYTNFQAGSIIFPQSKLNLIFNIIYQFRYPYIKYLKPNCYDNRTTTYSEYKELVNLSVLFWSAGLRVNF